MEDQIKQLVGKQEICKVKELNLSNCKSSNVTGLSEDYKSLESLEVDNVGLTTLKSFPRLVNLRKLKLSNNLLSEGLDALACLPKLTTVDLSGNKIKDLDVLQPLSEIGTLTDLNLKECDITKIEHYRRKIFDLFPTLKCLDGVIKAVPPPEDDDIEDEEVEDEEDDLDEDDEDSLGEEEEEDEEGEAVPLSALYNKINEEDDDDEEEDEDFEGDVEAEDDEDVDEEEDEGAEDVAVANLSVEKVDSKTRGKKRKATEEVPAKKEAKK